MARTPNQYAGGCPRSTREVAEETGWSLTDANEAHRRLANLRPRISSVVRNMLLQEHLRKTPPSRGLDKLLDSIAAQLALPEIPPIKPISTGKQCRRMLPVDLSNVEY